MITKRIKYKLTWLRRISLALLVTTSGCGVFFHSTSTQRPFNPTNDNSDLVIVRTSDKQYYYIVDTKRSVCFFHAKMYGRTHLVSLPCEDIPEYEDIMGLAPRKSAATPTPAKQDPAAAKTSDSMPIPPKKVSRTPPAEKAPALDTKEMAKVETAFIELQCNRRKGKIEDLETLLERHSLSLDTWEEAMNELQATPERWSTLHDNAAKQCSP
jgi:hypothetical protein